MGFDLQPSAIESTRSRLQKLLTEDEARAGTRTKSTRAPLAHWKASWALHAVASWVHHSSHGPQMTAVHRSSNGWSSTTSPTASSSSTWRPGR